ncbi:hypothetical protein [Halomonas sp. YLGW01]|uniref:hypothetical protein n=1 Tax=Halomonas sp. YLGW01 TaxID=2773308 RepID=UPI00177BA131|nr:hypothetical protein [Halomonas sp. YLGW01]
MHGEDVTPPTRRHRLRRGALGLTGLLMLLAAAYLVGMYWLLNGGWLEKRLSQVPGVTVSWSAASSRFPGQLRVHDLQLKREGSGLPLGLELETAELEVSIWALFLRRLEIPVLKADGLRSLSLGEHRLSGRGGVQLNGLRLDEQHLALSRLRLALEEAEVWRDEERLARDIRLDADLGLAALRVDRLPSRTAARAVSGTLSLAAEADAWDVFNPYLRGLDGLSLAGRGRLAGDLTLEQGRLAPDSELTLESPHLQLTLKEGAWVEATSGEGDAVASPDPGGQHFRLDGSGSVSVTVEATGEPRLMVVLDDMLMQPPQGESSFMTSRHFRLEARLPDADLAAPPRPPTAATLVWEGARLPDVGVLARYLPDPLPFALHDGNATLEGRLDYRDGVIEGAFTLVGEAVTLTLLDSRVGGELRLDLAITELDLRRQRLDLSGTRLRVGVSQAGEDALPVTELILHEAALSATRPLAERRHAPDDLPVEGRLVITGRVSQLRFLDSFLNTALDGRGLALEGEGELAATLEIRQGRLAPASQLTITAGRLGARFLDFRARGQGQLSARWPADAPARLRVSLTDARLERQADGQRLLQAGQLSLEAVSESSDPLATVDDLRLDLSWQDAKVPDVSVLNAYLPPAAPFALLGGQSTSAGQVTFSGAVGRGRLRLNGEAIRGRLFGETLEGELALTLVMPEARLDGSRLDLSGTRLEMQAASERYAMRAAGDEARLRSTLIARQARFAHVWPIDAASAPASGRLIMDGLVANLGFLDAFLPEAHGLAVRGNGRLSAELAFADANLLPGSHLSIGADALTVGFLEHQARGDGRLEAWVEGGPATPDLRWRISLPSVALGRQGEATEQLTGRHFSLETTLPMRAIAADREALDRQITHIQLPIAEVADLTMLNDYLPAGAGLEWLSGQAGLSLDLTLAGLQAQGELTLTAFDAGLRLGEQRVSGDLQLEARLRDGDLARMSFDASGSRLRLDNVSRQAANGENDEGWWVQLDLDEGRLVWARPLELNARLSLAMRDSGLPARLLVATARERRWLGRLLDVSGILGSARVRLGQEGLRVSEARLTGRQLEILADLVRRDDALTGALYARFGALSLGVALRDGESRLRFVQPRRWYEESRDDAAAWIGATPEEEQDWRRSLPMPEATAP